MAQEMWSYKSSQTISHIDEFWDQLRADRESGNQLLAEYGLQEDAEEFSLVEQSSESQEAVFTREFLPEAASSRGSKRAQLLTSKLVRGLSWIASQPSSCPWGCLTRRHWGGGLEHRHRSCSKHGAEVPVAALAQDQCPA